VKVSVVPPTSSSPECAVVIDAIRAFTTAAAAFAQGADRVVCVASKHDALRARSRYPRPVLVGERDGLCPQGFDLANSPTTVARTDVAGASVVLWTENGTRAIVGADAGVVLAAAAVNLSATAGWIATAQPSTVDLIPTAPTGEDDACAAHLAKLLTGEEADRDDTRAKVYDGAEAHLTEWTHQTEADRDRFRADIDLCASVDRYPFVMRGRRDLVWAVVLDAEPA